MTRSLAVAGAVCVWLCASAASAQTRGVYPLGMSATGSGIVADPGLSYSNLFLFYSRDKAVGPDGEVTATGQNSVLMDMNTLAWVSEKRVFGDAKFSMAATLPIANNSLSSDLTGAISGGGGLADSFYQPAIFGWHFERADIKAAYGFLAPTGSFDAASYRQRRVRLLDARRFVGPDVLPDGKQADRNLRFSNVRVARQSVGHGYSPRRHAQPGFLGHADAARARRPSSAGRARRIRCAANVCTRRVRR